MIVRAKVICTRKFSVEGKSYVTIQGFMENKGMFSQTVREELIPDKLEGRQIEMAFDIGIANNFKPYLKLEEIALLKEV